MRPNAFEEIDRGDEGTVRDISGPVSASEDAANPADGVDDRRTRVPGLGEWAGSPVTRKHAHLLRYLTGLAFKVFAKEGRMVFRRPTVRSEALPFFRTMMTRSSLWSLFLGSGLNISWSETVPWN